MRRCQAQITLVVLLVSILAEVSGNPFETGVSARHRVLPRLELSALVTLWGTMWCGTMLFTLQSMSGQEGTVVFLTVLVVAANAGMLGWLGTRLVRECAWEKRDMTGRLAQLASVGLSRISSMGSFRSHRPAGQPARLP